MTETLFEGGCLCGAVRYRASAAPLRGVICHCSMCRKHSGAPMLAFVHFALETFTWLTPPPDYYTSSAFAARGFCRVCGSTVTMAENVLHDRVQIALGSLDDASSVCIDDHVWTREQLPWLHIDDDLPRHDASSDAVPSDAATPQD